MLIINFGTNTIGNNTIVSDNVTPGVPSWDSTGTGPDEFPDTTIGADGMLRSGTIIYSDVVIGNKFSTGHHVMIREKTTIGDGVSVETNTIIEGDVTIGNNVSLQSLASIPTGVSIEDNVSIGPNAVLTNDPYPLHGGDYLTGTGPVFRKGAFIGANATLHPGVTTEGCADVCDTICAYVSDTICAGVCADVCDTIHEVN